MESDQDIHLNTLSSWIKQLIEFVYKQPNKYAMEVAGMSAHDIRGIAATLVFRSMTSMEDLLRSGRWKNHTTFTDHYLKDLSAIDSEELIHLGPIVAGQKVIVHSKIV